jgi:hypothetical protein
MPESWDCVAWKARGGYGSQGTGRGRDNAGRERIWFSPNCRRPMSLFSGESFAGFLPPTPSETTQNAVKAVKFESAGSLQEKSGN